MYGLVIDLYEYKSELVLVKFSFTFTMSPSSEVVNVLNCKIVVSEFELKSRYYIHFRANTLGKDMNLLIPPAMG